MSKAGGHMEERNIRAPDDLRGLTREQLTEMHDELMGWLRAARAVALRGGRPLDPELTRRVGERLLRIAEARQRAAGRLKLV
jgi:hypothetical protein